MSGTVCQKKICPPSSPGGTVGRGREGMTIYELGVQYGMTAAVLRGRIVELERMLEEAQDETERQQLEGRIRPLRAMYRETRAVARHLQGYYIRTGSVSRRKAAGGRRRVK